MSEFLGILLEDLLSAHYELSLSLSLPPSLPLSLARSLALSLSLYLSLPPISLLLSPSLSLSLSLSLALSSVSLTALQFPHHCGLSHTRCCYNLYRLPSRPGWVANEVTSPSTISCSSGTRVSEALLRGTTGNERKCV